MPDLRVMSFNVRCAGLDRTCQPPQYPSDHYYPLWAELEL